MSASSRRLWSESRTARARSCAPCINCQSVSGIAGTAADLAPALEGGECPRTDGIEATLLTITDGRQRVVAPACAGGRVVLTGERPLVGSATIGLIEPDVVVDYPYDPKKAAALLFSIVMDERRKTAWDRMRGTGP